MAIASQAERGQILGLLDELLALCQNGLERLWLQTLQQRGYLLPDKAQSPVPDHYVVPDFTYVEAAAAAAAG